MPTAQRHFRAAVIDIGSNSIKFMLGHQDGSQLNITHESAHTTRLGHKLELTGKISSKSRQATLEVLRKCKQEADRFGVQKIVAVGTSALRSATNNAEVLSPAKKILGTAVKVISGRLEGSLVYAGTSSFHKWQDKEALVIDVGGGSVEFVYGRKGKVLKVMSLPLGCVRVYDSLLPDQPATADQLDHAVELLTAHMKRKFSAFLDLDAFLIGSGGTMMTLTALHTRTSGRVDFRHFEGLSIRRHEMQQRLLALAGSSLDELRSNPCIPPGRAEVITSGCAVFYAAMKILHAQTIHCTTRGLRYGVWQKMLAPLPFKSVHYENLP